MPDMMIPRPLASRAGFASGPGGLLTVGFLAVLVVAALTFALDSRPGDLAPFAEATLARRVLPSCSSVVSLPSEPVREGGMGYFFARRIERVDDGTLVLTRTLDSRRVRLAAGAVGGAILLWIVALVVFHNVDSSRLDEVLDRRPALKIAALLGAGLPMAAVGLVLAAGIFFVLPLVPHTVASRQHVMRIAPEQVTVEARILPGRTQETVLPGDRIVGVDAWLGVRIAYRDEDGTLRAVRVPMADEEQAANLVCAVVQVLQADSGG